MRRALEVHAAQGPPLAAVGHVAANHAVVDTLGREVILTPGLDEKATLVRDALRSDQDHALYLSRCEDHCLSDGTLAFASVARIIRLRRVPVRHGRDPGISRSGHRWPGRSAREVEGKGQARP